MSPIVVDRLPFTAYEENGRGHVLPDVDKLNNNGLIRGCLAWGICG